MKLLSTSHSIIYDAEKGLTLHSRPGFVTCVGFVFFALLTVGCFVASVSTHQWGPLVAGLVPAFWAWIIGIVVWMEWVDLHVPKKSDGPVAWRDGLKTGVVPAERVLGAMVDAHVQPKLHKGPGPATFLTVWICDAELVKEAGVYPWRRLFSVNTSSGTEAQVKAEFEKLRGALKALGYDDRAIVEAKLKRGGAGF
jgi:hypothetical protein